MKLKDVYITVSGDREIKVVPRSRGKPKLPFVYDDSGDPKLYTTAFLALCEYGNDERAAFRELMKVDEFRELPDAQGLEDMRLGLDPRQVGLTATELYARVVEQIYERRDKGMSEKQIKHWYRDLVAERKRKAA